MWEKDSIQEQTSCRSPKNPQNEQITEVLIEIKIESKCRRMTIKVCGSEKQLRKRRKGNALPLLSPCELHVEAGGLTEGFPWIHQHKCSSIIASVCIPQYNASTDNHLN